MITLLVEDYCQHCPDFEADVQKQYFDDFYNTVNVDTNIKCIHRNKCAHIKNYLEKEIKK